MNPAVNNEEIQRKIILKYDVPGPRYTSYPPANFFRTGFSAEDYKKLLEGSNQSEPRNISVYIHIPFCTRRCHFCGCNTTLYENDDIVSAYIEALINEIKTTAAYIDKKNRKVTQVHWGGGTPNSIEKKYITKVMNELRSLFSFSAGAEIAIECNPAYLDDEYVKFLKNEGFNRISLGIQDFNTSVLNSVNRLPSKLPYPALMQMLRDAGFSGINLDFIYGLPGQTVESFGETIREAIRLSPDRLVTFSYAHVPWVMTEQKKLEDIGLPSPGQKLSMFISSMKIITENGYEQIGLDHYAKPGDELAEALKAKKLHRNFQGYCTRETTGQVYGFGCSSISQLYGGYSQNEKNIRNYCEKINLTGFAVERGYKLNFEEQVCKVVINEIMCNGFVSFDEIAGRFSVTSETVKAITGYNPGKLTEIINDNLITVADDKLGVSKAGMLIVRNIAMVFDPMLNTGGNKYSRTI